MTTHRHPVSRPRSAPPSPSRHDRALIRCLDVGRTFGAGERAVVAVHAVSLSVLPHDRIALIGPSGSGKTTLLHLIAGLETPTVGTIVRAPAATGSTGSTASTASPGDRSAPDIGIVFQAPSLIPGMTVLENVALPLQFAEQPDAEERARHALAELGLAELGDALPQELSGGQAQRAVIARVFALRPAVILADEPTSRLDRVAADHVAELLVSVADEIGAAVLVSTHDETIAARLSTRWRIRDGRLSTADTAAGRAS